MPGLVPYNPDHVAIMKGKQIGFSSSAGVFKGYDLKNGVYVTRKRSTKNLQFKEPSGGRPVATISTDTLTVRNADDVKFVGGKVLGESLVENTTYNVDSKKGGKIQRKSSSKLVTKLRKHVNKLNLKNIIEGFQLEKANKKLKNTEKFVAFVRKVIPRI